LRTVLVEGKARDGRVIAVATENATKRFKNAPTTCYISRPPPELLAPIPEIVPLQLLAYHIAAGRNCDVDKPRNLFKSVTVE
jgi:glucosamine--fructose-6-phosphate aminotransferase (isomerizing)